MSYLRSSGLFLLAVCLLSFAAKAQVPGEVNYQGRIMENGQAFSGSGNFKFALCSQSGSTTYWSNDMTSVNCGEPSAAVALTVDQGIYEVGLGDPAKMSSFPSDLFDYGDLYLRVWFGEGSTVEQLDPLQKVTSVFYALNADKLRGMAPEDLGGLPPGMIIVAPQGGDTTTIAGGLLMANTVGDQKVWVAPGFYSESNLIIPPNTTVECMVPRGCFLDCNGSTGFDIPGNELVRIKGFIMQNSPMECVRIGPHSEDIEITDNEFRGCRYGVNVMSGGSVASAIYIRHNLFGEEEMPMNSIGVNIDGGDLIWIDDNEFTSLNMEDARGVSANQARIMRVRNNIFSEIEGTNDAGAIMLMDSSTVWVENNIIHGIQSNTAYGIAAQFSRTLFIRHNDIVKLNPMGGNTAIGIGLQENVDSIVEGNAIRDFTSSPYAYGIYLEDEADYRVVDNKITNIGITEIYNPTTWGISYRHLVGMVYGMNIPKQIMMDNHITSCHNGINVDFSILPEFSPFTAEKVIKGNIILDGDSTGYGIRVFDTNNIEIIENKVVNYDYGLDVYNSMIMPSIFHIMRNELWRNNTQDLNIVDMMGGTYRVMYNFMDNYSRPAIPPASSVEGANLNSVGGTP